MKQKMLKCIIVAVVVIIIIIYKSNVLLFLAN